MKEPIFQFQFNLNIKFKCVGVATDSSFGECTSSNSKLISAKPRVNKIPLPKTSPNWTQAHKVLMNAYVFLETKSTLTQNDRSEESMGN